MSDNESLGMAVKGKLSDADQVKLNEIYSRYIFAVNEIVVEQAKLQGLHNLVTTLENEIKRLTNGINDEPNSGE